MRPSPMRSFDPHRVEGLECRAWETYYRRKWALLVRSYAALLAAVHR
jgi:hypothetical protein